ncbi:MAG: DUF1592 domain-containing protein [Planctomycetaceae bacterium]
MAVYKSSWSSALTLALSVSLVSPVVGEGQTAESAGTGLNQLTEQFNTTVQPFLANHCIDCHGADDPQAKLDLSRFRTVNSVSEAHQTWQEIIERLEADEMPPAEIDHRPTSEQRREIIDWITAAREFEAARHAGDPGLVLARRLSNAEYNYTIRDLTGVDIRPTATFPVDPANEAGFDNSGESLALSPGLLNKYLEAARHVVEHLVLKPDGIAFAPHPVVTDTDRDKYCVKRIVEFYLRQPVDYAAYFRAAWQYRHRAAHGRADASLDDLAAANQISSKYLSIVWSLLNDAENSVGPVAKLQAMFRDLPSDSTQTDTIQSGCERMRDFVTVLRGKLVPKFDNLRIEGVHVGSQPFVLWKNRQYAAHRRSFDPAVLVARSDAPDDDASEETATVDADLLIPAGDGERARHEAAFAKFCRVFPDAFFISERGRDYVKESEKQQGEKGRLLSAGFHSMMGYFRDDGPLYDMVLNESQRQELDSLWRELDFVASAPMRQYVGFLWFERTDSRFMRDPQFDFARAEDREAQSAEMIQKLAEVYLAKAEANGGEPVAMEAIAHYFREINEQIRWVENARLAAEPSHLQAVQDFAERAYRRPLSSEERDELVAFYRTLRGDDGLTHEEAIQDAIVSILVSPHFSYRLDLGRPDSEVLSSANGRRQLTAYELASRLSYFLWSSMPDETLLQAAASGKLHDAETLLEQTQRMLRDDRVRGLATEFGGNWLDFRRFEEHNSVDRERFPEFTDELRQAMFEEPIRFFVDVAQNDRSVLDFLNADHTFVNDVLARHYGIPVPEEVAADDWDRIDNAAQYSRGGLLPMSVFLTKNAPGLRTSPVKRGYWVVRRLLGERIPPPPPNVPELPNDESRLGDLTLREALAQHRDNKSCAGCHERIDSVGLVFEGFGPVGERRDVDLGGRPVDTAATLPGGIDAADVGDLQTYLVEQRRDDFLDNLCRKLLSYALGRSLILSDELLIRDMRSRLESDDFRFGSLIESIVTSPQFLNKRNDSSTPE